MQVLSFLLIGTVAAIRVQNHVVKRMPTQALPDVFGPVTPAMFERARDRRSRAAQAAHIAPGTGSRAGNSCNMCVNFVLHQDTTQDWTPEFRAQIGGQFQHILQDLHDNHPGSTFSVVTFQDKPIPELGEPTDYCVSYDARMLSDPVEMLQIYASTPEGVGYDWPENQFGSLYELLNSPSFLPWGQHSECSNLVITITDASPHFEGDEWQIDYPQLDKYTPDYDEANAESFCTEKYYPTPFMVAEAMVDMDVYHGTIVWRAGDINTLALRSWEWFDSLVGENNGFTQALFDDDEDWMTPLENVLQAFITEECGPQPSTTPRPSTMPESEPSTTSSTIPTPTTTVSLPSSTDIELGTTPGQVGTTEPLVSESTSTVLPTPAETSEGLSTQICNCPSEDPCCLRQPEVYLMIKKKPSEFDMHMKA